MSGREKKPDLSAGTAWPHCSAKAATPPGTLIPDRTAGFVGYCRRCGWTTPNTTNSPIDAMQDARTEHGHQRC